MTVLKFENLEHVRRNLPKITVLVLFSSMIFLTVASLESVDNLYLTAEKNSGDYRAVEFQSIGNESLEISSSGNLSLENSVKLYENGDQVEPLTDRVAEVRRENDGSGLVSSTWDANGTIEKNNSLIIEVRTSLLNESEIVEEQSVNFSTDEFSENRSLKDSWGFYYFSELDRSVIDNQTVTNATFKWGYGYDSRIEGFEVSGLSKSSEVTNLTARFSYSPENPVINETIGFNASESAGNISSFNWTMGDGTEKRGKSTNYSYPETGNFTVNLTVMDGNRTDSTVEEIEVNSNKSKENLDTSEPLKASFDYYPGEPEVNQTVTFNASSSKGVKNSFYEWRFGDGSTVIGEINNKSYDEPGNYTVKLTVANDTATDSTNTDIEISGDSVAENSTADEIQNTDLQATNSSNLTENQTDNASNSTKISFSYQPSNPLVNESVDFNASDSWPNYNWSFGDNSSAEGSEVNHTYDSTGDYTVVLEGYNETESEKFNRTISVSGRKVIGSGRGPGLNLSGEGGGSISFDRLQNIQADARINKYNDPLHEGYVDRILTEYTNNKTTEKKIDVHFAVPKEKTVIEKSVPGKIREMPEASMNSVKSKVNQNSNRSDGFGGNIVDNEEHKYFNYRVRIPANSTEVFYLKIDSQRNETNEMGVWIEGSFAGGSGTSGDPYLIENCSQLQDIQNDLAASYEIIDSFNCSGVSFNPIGGSSNSFGGTLTGRGNEISNLTLTFPNSQYVGLFGNIGSGGVVTNFRVKDASIDAFGIAGVISGLNQGLISKVKATTRTVIEIDGDYSNGAIDVGGIAGINRGEIDRSISEADVTLLQDTSRGGSLVGFNDGVINNSYAKGDVVNEAYYGGGLVGSNAGTVEESYSIGSVTNNDNFFYGSTGGLIGYDSGGSVLDSVWDVDLSGLTTSSGGTGLNSDQLKGCISPKQNTNLDFNGTWEADIESYPKLKWELDPGSAFRFSDGSFDRSCDGVFRTR